jgi:magnesium-transporting ATPase (P-type)
MQNAKMDHQTPKTSPTPNNLTTPFIGVIMAIIPILGWIALIFFVYPYIYLFYTRTIAWLYSLAFTEDYVP